MTPIRRELIAPVALSMIATVWAGLVAGPGLAIYLGATLIASFYVPFLTIGDRAAKCASECSVGIAIVLAAFSFHADVSLLEWFRCIIVIASLIFALAATANLLAWIRIPQAIAATFTSIIALLWMTWPVWMSHSLTQARVNWLVWPHPLLAINGVLQHLGSWDHSPIAYRQLTILNQDIPFELPRSIVPATLAHLLIGALLFIHRLRKKAGGPIEPPATDPAIT